MIRRQIVALGALGMIVLPLQAQTPPAQTPAAPAPGVAPATDDVAPAAGAVRRVIALRELGFAQGVEFAGLTGARELFFPLPRAADVRSLRLRLPYRSGSAFVSRRSLEIEIAGRPVFTTALAPETQDGVIDLPVDPAVIRNGFLPVRIRYSGAITEDRCVDQRVSGAFLSLGADGAVIADLAPGAFDTIAKAAAVMPRASDIILPARPSEAQAAAALTLAAGNPDVAFATGSGSTAFGNWTRSRVVLAGADAPALALAGGGSPELRLGGGDPAAAARLVRSRWRTLARAAQLPAATSAAGGAAAQRLTFADLGDDTGVQSIADRGSWTLSLPMTALPAGKRPVGLVVDVAVADDGSPTPPVVSVLMNGLLLGSAEAERGGRTRLPIDLPDGLVTAGNSIEVVVTRQVRSGDCAYAPQGYPAQLLPSSHVVLGDAGAPADFSDLAPAFAGGMTVVVPGPGALAGVSRLLGTLIDGTTPIAVRYGAVPESGAYVFVSNTPPSGTEPPIRFDRGRVEIVGEGQQALVDEAALGEFTVVQLLDAGGRAVLWVRPGKGFADLPPGAFETAGLARGNVAFVDADGVALAFSTERDRLVDIRYPDRTDFGQLLQRYRLWLIGFGWLIVSIGFIYLLRRIYQARKTDD